MRTPVAIWASAALLLLLLCFIAKYSSLRSDVSSVALYEPRYPPSNLRQGRHEFSPYGSEGVPPVYSSADVSQRNIWTGYDSLQPVYSANSHLGYAPDESAPSLAPRPRPPIQMSSRYFVRLVISALRRSYRQINKLHREVSHLENEVHMKHPISRGENSSQSQRHAKLEALSARVLRLQIRIARLESNSVPSVSVPQGRQGPQGSIGLKGSQVRAASSAARESLRTRDSVSEREGDAKVLAEYGKPPGFGSYVSTYHLSKGEHKLMFHGRRINVKSMIKAQKIAEGPNTLSSKSLKNHVVSNSIVIPNHSATKSNKHQER